MKYGVRDSVRVFAHSIDLSKIDDEIYLKTWVNQIANHFPIV